MPKAKQLPPPPPSANGHAPQTNDRTPQDCRRLFQTLGVGFASVSGAEALAEECPWCGKDRFYLNVETGQYHCKKCPAKGNVTTYLTWLHGEFLKATTTEHYLALKAKRGIASQTLRLHGLAYDAQGRRWLVPFKNAKGNVVNLQLYYPDKKDKPNKYMLPELPTALYGFDKLATADKSKPVLICEGPFDAIALDYSIGSANRPKYVIVATPGAFKEAWAEHFRGYKVRCFYDNDDGGRGHTERVQRLLGESGVAAELRALKWPEGTPDGYDLNDLVRERPGRSVLGWLVNNCYEVVRQPQLAWVNGWEGGADGPEHIDWPWPNHLRCGSYCSFSGKQGTLKSTVAREITARYTTGKALPGSKKVGLPAGHVIYVTAEDGVATARGSLRLAGADMNLVTILPAVLKDGDPMNILEHLDELRQRIRQYGVRLVIIDGQNSVVGAPCIATDMQARHNVTNKLHQFAQQENVCLVGIRNEDAEGRAYGPASMGDLARCVLRAEKVGEHEGRAYYKLVFVKVSDAAPSTHPPIPYSVEDLGGSSRRILWGKSKPKPDVKGQMDAAHAVKANAASHNKTGRKP